MSTAAPPPLPATYRRWSAEKHGGPGALKLVEAPLPRPGAGQLLLRVLATDATYTDLLVLSGNYVDVKSLPVTPGYECAAVVAALGAGTAPFAVGDRVLAMPMHGCAAEFVVLPARLVVRIEDAEGAAFVAAKPGVASSLALTGITAYQMLHRVMGPARIALARESGASILVHAAAGGTGAMLVQLAKLAGIPGAQIFGTCSRKNLDAVRALGATAVSYEDADWDAQVRAASPKGVVAVFDSVTTSDYYNRAIAMLMSRGIYCSIGFTDSAKPGAISIPSAIGKFAAFAYRHSIAHSVFCGADAQFYIVSGRRDAHPGEFAADVRELVRLAATGKLEVVVGKEWRFEDEVEALRSIEAGKHRGKQVVMVGGPVAA